VPRRSTVAGWLARPGPYAARHTARLAGLATVLACAAGLLLLVPSGDPVRELLAIEHRGLTAFAGRR
jgi:hypothetical protein